MPGKALIHMPYGEMLMEISNQDYNNPYKYNGKEFDEATGYYYYGARYYDPKRSFWISVDPLAEITQSPYTYVWNDPVNYIDPTGMMGEKPGGKGGPDPNKIYDGGSIQEVIVKGSKEAKDITERKNPDSIRELIAKKIKDGRKSEFKVHKSEVLRELNKITVDNMFKLFELLGSIEKLFDKEDVISIDY